MIKVNLFDSLFDHSHGEDGCYTSSFGRCPKEGMWVKNNLVWDGVTVFTDSHFNNPIVDKVQSKIKIAWLLESKAITPNAYSEIVNFENKFDYIFTHDESLLNRGPKYVKTVVGASRVDDNLWGLHEKNKLVSMIASNKKFTEGHNLRHLIANKFSNKHNIDMWGSGYKYFEKKFDVLKDYAYTICVMNTNVKNYFTEILIDPISVGCVPILWGCPNIGEFFNKNGIITFNTLKDLEKILYSISFEDYNYRVDAILENIEIAKKMKSTDDFIFTKIKNLI
jgi:hypothetical protein